MTIHSDSHHRGNHGFGGGYSLLANFGLMIFLECLLGEMLNWEFWVTTIDRLIKALEDDRVGNISGEQLILVWGDFPVDFWSIYDSLHHLISDEDIRKKD